MKRYFPLVVALSVTGQLFVACQKQNEEVKPASTPGYFVVSATSNASSAGGRTAQGAAGTEFDLGDLKASREFLFTLANGGEQPIFDVTLSSDQEAFEVSPKRIKFLPGKGNTGIVPLIQVGVLHGRQLNGTGIAPALPAGINTSTIRLKGKTLSNRDTVEVSSEFSVTVAAKVAGLTVYRNGVALTYSGGAIFHGQVDQLFGAPAGGKYTLVNTGNVPLRPVVYYDPASKNEFDLQPGETKEITSLLYRDSDYGLNYIEFSDRGVLLTTPISSRDFQTQMARILLQNQ